jgi:hypothetical protein
LPFLTGADCASKFTHGIVSRSSGYWLDTSLSIEMFTTQQLASLRAREWKERQRHTYRERERETERETETETKRERHQCLFLTKS